MIIPSHTEGNGYLICCAKRIRLCFVLIYWGGLPFNVFFFFPDQASEDEVQPALSTPPGFETQKSTIDFYSCRSVMITFFLLIYNGKETLSIRRRVFDSLSDHKRHYWAASLDIVVTFYSLFFQLVIVKGDNESKSYLLLPC